MDSDYNRQQLEQAYDLIQQDQHDDAVRFLRRVLENEITNSAKDNADAWWLMANAVEDPTQARRALINVLKYDPKNAMASQTLDELNDQFPPNDEELTMLLELERTSDFDLADLSAPLTDDELSDLFAEDADLDLSAFGDDDEDPFAELAAMSTKPDKTVGKKGKKSREGRKEGKRNSILGPVVVILGAVVIATLLFMVANQNNDGTADEGTPDIVQLVEQPVDANNTNMVSLVNNVQADAQQTVGDAAVFVVDEGGTQTLFVQTCICMRRECQGTPSSELFAVVAESFLTIAERAETQPVETIVAAGVNVQVCQSNDNVYRATTSIENVINYLNSNDLNAFRATWTVVEG